MLFLFVSVIVFGLSLCGTGSLFGRILGFSSPRNPWIYFWIGFFFASTLSMFVSLFAPVNVISLVIFFILGAAGLPFFYGEYKKTAAQFDISKKKIFIIIAFLAIVVITCFGAYVSWPEAYDTDLYHLQIIRWYNEYGTPPGLGNLLDRLAVNSSWHSLAALFDNGIWDTRSSWIMPALSLLGGIFYCLYEFIFSRRNGTRLYVLCILLWLGLEVELGSASPALWYDTPVHIINALIFLEAYYILFGYNMNLSKKEIHDSAILLMLSVSAFMIKPIGAVSLLFSGLLTLFLLIRNSKQTVSSWFIVFTPALCAFAVWVTRNILLSGYPLYPLPIFAIPFDWTMPFESVDDLYKLIKAFARMPDPVNCRQSLENGFLFWFVPWLFKNLTLNAFLRFAVLPSLLSLLFWFFVVKYKKTKIALYFFIWNVLSIFYWFVSAPDIRFGDGFFWLWLGTAFLFLVPDGYQFKIPNLWKNQKVRSSFFYMAIVLIICCFVLLFPQIRKYIIEIAEKFHGKELRDLHKWMEKQLEISLLTIIFLSVLLIYLFRKKLLLVIAVSIVAVLGGIGFNAMSQERDLFMIGTIKFYPVKEYTVDTVPPFNVWIPLDPKEARTGNSPLPSKFIKPTNLEMREPGNLGKGFRVRQN